MSERETFALGFAVLCGVSPAMGCTRTKPELNAASMPATARTEVLLKRAASWNEVPYVAYPQGQPELTTVRITIPAHSSLPWHTHEMPNAAYLLSGHLTVEERDTGRTATYHAGEAFAESVHNVHRGFTDSEPAVVIVTYAGTTQTSPASADSQHE